MGPQEWAFRVYFSLSDSHPRAVYGRSKIPTPVYPSLWDRTLKSKPILPSSETGYFFRLALIFLAAALVPGIRFESESRDAGIGVLGFGSLIYPLASISKRGYRVSGGGRFGFYRTECEFEIASRGAGNIPKSGPMQR
jgi:hypothetical protein